MSNITDNQKANIQRLLSYHLDKILSSKIPLYFNQHDCSACLAGLAILDNVFSDQVSASSYSEISSDDRDIIINLFGKYFLRDIYESKYLRIQACDIKNYGQCVSKFRNWCQEMDIPKLTSFPEENPLNKSISFHQRMVKVLTALESLQSEGVVYKIEGNTITLTIPEN